MNLLTELPPTLSRQHALLHELKARQEDSVRVFPIGKSVLGRELWAVGIGRLCGPALYAGGFHAQEWLTTSLLWQFAQALTEAWLDDRPLGGMRVRAPLSERGVLIIPCVNPDGIELVLSGPETAGPYRSLVESVSGGDYTDWNANIRGVDLNHNFDAGFHTLRQMEREAGIDGPAPRRFSGYSPFSEPETRALRRICLSFGVNRVLAFHSQGEEIFYRYGPCLPPRADLVARVLASLSGYALVEPSGMASHGGFKDWFIEKLFRPGFTIEIGKGRNPLPISDLTPIYHRLLDMMVAGLML